MNGNLNYYHNTGTETSPVFSFESDNWGGVDVRATGYITGYSTPYMYRNENDSLYLIVGSQSGRIFLFNEIEDALLGEFYEADTNLLEYHFGVHTSAIFGDINQNGKPDYLTGNVRGGIQVFEKSFMGDVEDLSADRHLQIFPNPASSFITVNVDAASAAPYKVEMINSSGQRVLSATSASAGFQIATSHLPQGIYTVRVITGDAIYSSPVVLLKQ
jgi:hypothetical protein